MQEGEWSALIEAVKVKVEQSGVFGDVRIESGRLLCNAAESAEPATYRLERDDAGVWVALVMADRWQSESIESDLMHTGDKLDELLDEELADLGYDGPALTYEHFRSDDMLFTFRSKVPLDQAAGEPQEMASLCLLGYEACFRELGDMSAGAEEE